MEQVNPGNPVSAHNEQEVNPKVREITKKINDAFVAYGVKDSSGKQITVEAVYVPDQNETDTADKLEALITKCVPDRDKPFFMVLLAYIRSNTIVYSVSDKKDLMSIKEYNNTIFNTAKDASKSDEERSELAELSLLYEQNRLRRNTIAKTAKATDLLTQLYPSTSRSEEVQNEIGYIHKYVYPIEQKNENGVVEFFSEYENLSVEERVQFTKRFVVFIENAITATIDGIRAEPPSS